MHPEIGSEVYSANAYALNELISRKGSKLNWKYDFGDRWKHTIKLVGKIKDDGTTPLLEVTKAKNACPPEDCGGVWGYANLLEAIADKKHPEHNLWKEWLGSDFNPHQVSLNSLNHSIKSLLGN